MLSRSTSSSRCAWSSTSPTCRGCAGTHDACRAAMAAGAAVKDASYPHTASRFCLAEFDLNSPSEMSGGRVVLLRRRAFLPSARYGKASVPRPRASVLPGGTSARADGRSPADTSSASAASNTSGEDKSSTGSTTSSMMPPSAPWTQNSSPFKIRSFPAFV